MTVLMLAVIVLTGLLIFQQHRHRRALQKLNADLDSLLLRGTPLPIDQYREGELSILASQMEKITLRLTEAADRVQHEKENLADSLADISHQLRTPMTSMNLAVTMLRKPDLDRARRMELTAELRSQLQRVDWLVETLLKLSKLDAGTVELSTEQLPLRDLIARSAEPLAIAMDVREISLRIHCAGGTFTGDPGWTAEAVGNILKNCMEHTPAGGSVTVTAEETPLFVKIEIEDTGEGIAPADLPHIFDRFYQGANACPTSYGIGLSLAKAIITAQNGTVQARNTATGARFTVKFYQQII